MTLEDLYVPVLPSVTGRYLIIQNVFFVTINDMVLEYLHNYLENHRPKTDLAIYQIILSVTR